MAKQEKPLAKFEDCVSNILREKLTEAEAEIKAINNSMSVDDVAEILEDANSLVSFACGKDDALYEEWRYRFIIDDKGAYWIIQGREVGVDPRDWSGKADPEE